jgi:TonB family protein
MTESVSDILVARQRQFEGGVGRPVAMSLVVHVLLIVGLVLLPAAWFQGRPKEKTMTITLGAGSLGVIRSGKLQTGGKRVEEVVEPKKQEPLLPVTPPKAVTPDPAAPVVKVPPKTADKPSTVPPAPAKPATGAKITPGSAAVETGAKGLEVGLSSSGGGNNSAEMDFCCKEYLQDMLNKIDAVWVRNQGITGETWVDFVIEKDGKITGVHTSKSSGYPTLDFAAERAISFVKLGPIPELFKGSRIPITLKMAYTR